MPGIIIFDPEPSGPPNGVRSEGDLECPFKAFQKALDSTGKHCRSFFLTRTLLYCIFSTHPKVSVHQSCKKRAKPWSLAKH
jgi:hypothetical protein